MVKSGSDEVGIVRQFLKDSLVYGLTSVLTRAAWLLSLPFLTRKLAPESFGVLELVLLVAAMLLPVLGLELHQAFARHFSLKETLDRQRRHFSSVFWPVLVICLLFVSAGLVGAEFWMEVLWQEDHGITALVASLFYIASSILFYHQCAFLRYSNKAWTYCIGHLAQATVGIGVGATGVWLYQWSVADLLIALAAGHAVGWLIGFVSLRHLFVFAFDVRMFGRLVHFSAPLVLAALSAFIGTWTDRIMISYWLGLHDLGIYSVAYRMAGIGSLLIMGFQMAFAPVAFQHYEEAEAPNHLARIMCLCATLVFPAVLAVGLFSEELIVIFLGAGYAQVLQLWFPLAVAILLSQAYFFAPGMAIAKKTKWVLVITIIAACVNALLNVLLIPLWGLMGAVVATLVGGGSHFALWMAASQRLYPIPYPWRRIGSAGITLFVLWLVGSYLPMEGVVEWLVKLSLIFVMFYACYLFELVSREELRSIYSLLRIKLLTGRRRHLC